MNCFKSKAYLFYLLALSTLLGFACNFGDTNIDPVRPSEASVDELLPLVITQSVRNINSIGGRVTGIIVQHYNGIDAQPLGYAQYLVDERTLDVFWKNGLYAGAMKDCEQIINQATEKGLSRYAGIARIMMAHNLGIATSFWGDIPYSEAFQGAALTQPFYDRQEQIYEQIQSLLRIAISDMERATDTTAITADLIFGGKPSQWIATAYALRARYYLQLSRRNPEAAQEALQMIEMGAFYHLQDQPLFQYQNNHNEGNPFALYQLERSRQMVVGDCLLSLLQSTQDPRLSKMGIEEDEYFVLYQANNDALYWSQLDTPIPLISLTELKFIEAEALLRLQENEAAELVFKAAVNTHFEQMDMELDDYESFRDTTVHFLDCNDFDARLEKLIRQKYIALFAQSATEAWNDYRRTGYPRLTPPSDANASFNPSLVIPRRYLYPTSERNTNATANQQAIDQQGGHLMDVDVWVYE